LNNKQLITQKRITFSITDKCTLRCKKCAGYFPFYAKNPWDPDLRFLQETVDMAFQVFDEIGIFNIEGGEPLIRKDLPAILSHLRKYEAQISREIRFITNGTIIPSTELIAECKAYGDKMYFIVDDYGSELSKNAAAAVQILTENGIRNELRVQRGDEYFGGWIDFGPFTSRNYTAEQREHIYNLCKGTVVGGERQFVLKKGLIYPCARGKRLGELGVIDFQDFVDLFDETDISIKREKLLQIKAKPYLEACGYCNGFSQDAPKILAGEQYTNKEMANLNDFDY